MKKTWTPGKIIAAVFGGIGACVVLIVSLYASLQPLSANIKILDRMFFDSDESRGGKTELLTEIPDKQQPEEKQPDEEQEDEALPDSETPAEKQPDKKKPVGEDQYYEFHSEIKNNLSYQIDIEDFAEYAASNSNALAAGDYPKVICEDKNKEKRVNSIIHREIEAVLEHLEYIGQELEHNTFFEFDVESYVTYMDEDTLSVAYVEYGYLDDEPFESYVIAVNVDMESGLAMTNTQILNINDDFSIDFRERTERQNGSNDLLDYYSDQEITEMLNDEDSLIIFYTPLGMEVGFNFYYGWVTVTYPDYEKFGNPL